MASVQLIELNMTVFVLLSHWDLISFTQQIASVYNYSNLMIKKLH